MNHKQGRKLLRECNRRERREAIRGLWLYRGRDGKDYAMRADGLPKAVQPIPYLEATGGHLDVYAIRAAIRDVTGIDRLPA